MFAALRGGKGRRLTVQREKSNRAGIVGSLNLRQAQTAARGRFERKRSRKWAETGSGRFHRFEIAD
jgi:hypothetical protein